ncbi:MAG: hypothetical protein V4619_14395 [Bacteroidota bacterium]
MINSRALRMLSNCLNVNTKLIFRLSFFGSIFLCLAFIPKPEDNPFDTLVNRLQRWTDTIPQEKIYLHMDKPYYALGDTIWFKGYLTIGSRHQLSKLSGAVYVDLINERDSLLKSLKLPVTAGMVMGDFVLVDDYHQGSYRIRAYTQWMRNAGPEYFFDRTFTVGDLLTNNLVAKADYQYRTTDGKQELTALLNFTNDEGKALGERNLRYQIVIGNKVVWTQNIKTDALGSASIKIDNAAKANLNGAYIRATIESADKYAVTRDFPIKAEKAQSDVQFFPESGGLVNGIASRVGFKAIGVDGLGISIKGTVIDDTGTEAAQISTLHAGMGSFILKPQEGKSYSAKITFPDGTAKTIALPTAVVEGYTLGIYQPGKDSVLVRINASASLLKQPQSVGLIAHTGGENIFSSTLKITKPITSVWLNKKDFPSGIAQFTLFDAAGQPVNERIAFIRNKDVMELDIKPNKDSYKSKEHIKIALDAKDSKGKPTAANFSVTVIDEGKMPVDESKESTIFSNILLTSDLKGYIERPNYYFTKETDEVNRALDNLMLTQGYRRFIWSKLDSLTQAKPKFEVEGLGAKVTGRVATLTNQPLPNADVVLNSVIAGVTKFTKTNDKGRFTFDGIFLTDSLKFAVQARGDKGTNKVKILVDSVRKQEITPNPNLGDVSTNVANTLKEYIDNGKKLDDIYLQSGQLDKVHRLREVRIKARKPAPPIIATQGMYRIPDGIADQTIMMHPTDSVTEALGAWLAQKVKIVTFRPFAGVVNHPWMKDLRTIPPPIVPMKIMLDGRKVDLDEAAEILDGYQIQPEAVYKVEVVWGTLALLHSLGGPTLMIYTRRDYVRKNYTPNIANIKPKGFNKVREFYAPRYDKPGSGKLPDLRTTIHWNPYLKTDANGKTSFSFFNADGAANYKVIVEGINADGELGRQVYRYRVDAAQAEQGAVAPLIKPDKNMAAIIAPLDSFNTRFPVEKVYVHTDKPYYNIGDTLWFKAYLVDKINQAPSKISGTLYVDMADDTATMARRVSVPVKDGVAYGQIPLTKAIFHEGGYQFRAYTNWMQNFDSDHFFNRRIYVGTAVPNGWLVNSAATVNKAGEKDELKVNIRLNKIDKDFSPVALKKVEVKIFDDWHWIYKENHQTGLDGSLNMTQLLKEKTDVTNMHVQITSLEKGDVNKVLQVPLTIVKKIELQFLPESGKLVAGLKSTVGFKALSDNGNGTPVSGAIFDSKNNQVAQFTSLYNGMGAFEFTPKAGEKYTARITKPNPQSVDLPAVNPAGTVMHFSNAEQSPTLSVTISATPNVLPADTACYLVGTSRGMMYYWQKIEAGQAELKVAKNLFPTGIARFTLFAGKRPLNERVVYIDHHDGLNFKISTNKARYNKRDSVGLEIEVSDKNGFPVKGEFSLAVTDDSQVRADSVGNNNMATSMLLSAELKGNIETPGYYINRKHKDAWQALDNLLLTQGWTGYDWQDIFVHNAPIAYTPEKDFRITGLVSNVSKKPLPGVPVIISSRKPSFLATTLTDSAGIYTFKNLPQIDTGSFFIQANNKNGKKMSFGNINVKNFVAPAFPAYTAPVMPWYVNTDTVQLNNIQKKMEKDDAANVKMTGIVLKQVNIKSTKIIRDSFNPLGSGNADMVFDQKDIKESEVMNLYEFLKLKIPGFNTRPRANGIPVQPKINKMSVGIRIDGWALPLHIDNKYDEQEYIDELRQIKVVTFDAVEVISSATRLHMLKSTLWPSMPYILIATKNGNGWYRFPKTGTVTYRPLPVMKAKEFYSPKYNVKPLIIEPDYRPTIYWQPNVSTDANGRAKVSFYTSDNSSPYTLKIAGINSLGGIGDGNYVIDCKPALP